jgi:AAA family ATPase
VHVLPLPAKPLQGKAFPPALRQVVSTSSILLEEVEKSPASTSSSVLARKVAGSTDTKDKTRDWLSLLVKEVLGKSISSFATEYIPITNPYRVVDLKYITHSLVLDVPYEGRTRRFVLSSDSVPVSTTTTNSTSSVKDDLSTKIESMSIWDITSTSRNESTVWTVNWNTTVSLTTLDDMVNKSKGKPSSGTEVHAPSHPLILSNPLYSCMLTL